MITIKVDGLQGVQDMLNKLRTQDIPRAASMGLNSVITKISDKNKEDMKASFDRPTDWTMRAFKINKATPGNLVASLQYNRGRNFMQTQVSGGSRGRKSGETLLTNKGLMAGGQMYVPGYGARKDAFGNMSRGQISQVMSFFRAYTGKNARNNRRDGDAALRSGVQFFSITSPGKGLKPGIYQRVLTGAQSSKLSASAKTSSGLRKAIKSTSKRGILPVLYFNPRKQYSKRLKFFETGQATVNREAASSFAWAIRQVLK